jgi:hypothetical protein
MTEERRYLSVAVACVLALIILLFNIKVSPAHDHDHPELDQWYKSLMQPDVPTVSCCGEADAYWADGFETQGDQYVAIVTDERPDGPLGRPHIPVGTKIIVPNNKLKYDQSNPTGHGVIFMSVAGYVWCYLPPQAS